MHTKNVTKIPIKRTLLALLVLVVTYLLLFVISVLVARLYNAECAGVASCMNTFDKVVIYRVISDLVFVSRICIELGFIFLVVQLFGKLFRRT